MADRIQIRRDLAANWTSVNPTLAQGEIGYETDTGKAKIGDGSTVWTSLAYRFTGVTDHTLLTNIGTNTHAQIDSHIASTANPHATTAAQVGAYTTAQTNTQISNAITAHEALADPHPGYLTAAEGSAAYQPLDATLTALAAFNSSGIVTQTAPDTFAARTLTAGTGISINNGTGVSGNPQITNIDTGTAAVATHEAAGDPHPQYLTAAEGGAAYQPIDPDLTAIGALAGAGFAVRTTTNTWATRSIVAGAGITVANSDGVFASPTVTNTDRGSVAVTAHEALADPHPGYLTTAEGNAAYAALSHNHALSQITQSAATTGQVPQWNGSAWVPVTPAGGVSDHGALTGLADDDHAQYHNDARGDARYYTQAQLNAGQLDTRYFTESEVTASLAGKANLAGGNAFTGLQTITNNTLRLTNTTGGSNQPVLEIVGAGAAGNLVGVSLTPFSGRTGGIAAAIYGQDDGNSSANMLFFTAPTGTATTAVERARINNDGSFGVGVGAANNSSAIAQFDSTTRGFLPPRMTTAQRAAIATPAAGLVVYDTTLGTLCYYDGTTWLFELHAVVQNNQTSTSATYANITELTTPSLPIGRYSFRFHGVYQTTSTGVGIGFRVGEGTGVLSAIRAMFQIQQAAPGTDAFFEYAQVQTTDNITSASALTANTDFPAWGSGIFSLSTAGTIAMQLRTETAGIGVSVRINSVLHIQKVRD